MHYPWNSRYQSRANSRVAQQAPFLRMPAEQRETLAARIVDRWDEIGSIAARVPSLEAIAAALRRVGGPASPAELGLSAVEAGLAARYGHYSRPRFTVARLRLMLGL